MTNFDKLKTADRAETVKMILDVQCRGCARMELCPRAQREACISEIEVWLEADA